MRGIKGLVCETSVLDSEEGIRYRGYTLPEVQKVSSPLVAALVTLPMPTPRLGSCFQTLSDNAPMCTQRFALSCQREVYLLGWFESLSGSLCDRNF
jgi:hypothetical protein